MFYRFEIYLDTLGGYGSNLSQRLSDEEYRVTFGSTGGGVKMCTIDHSPSGICLYGASSFAKAISDCKTKEDVSMIFWMVVTSHFASYPEKLLEYITKSHRARREAGRVAGIEEIRSGWRALMGIDDGYSQWPNA